jgi:hypothetical protein
MYFGDATIFTAGGLYLADLTSNRVELLEPKSLMPVSLSDFPRVLAGRGMAHQLFMLTMNKFSTSIGPVGNRPSQRAQVPVGHPTANGLHTKPKTIPLD